MLRRITDTLCGTKVLRREDFVRLKANCHYLGNLDLICGAAKLNLKAVEVPIRMVAFAYRRLKAG